jgi:hypothetical protein
VQATISLDGETAEDFVDFTDEQIIEEFKTYYNVTRKDFNLSGKV